MLKNEFFEKLKSNLDFLSNENIQLVLDFYESKIPADLALEDIDDLIQEIGDPDEIAKNIKLDLISPNSFQNKNSFNTKTLLSEEEKEDDDLIFSKPAPIAKASEVIYTFENKEMKTLYGEKVVIENKKTPEKKIFLEAIEEDSGFTNEEIELAKEETLLKASKFNTAALSFPEEQEDFSASEENDLENSDIKTAIEDNDTLSGKSEKIGLFAKFFTFLHLPKCAYVFFAVLLSIFFSPILFTVFP